MVRKWQLTGDIACRTPVSISANERDVFQICVPAGLSLDGKIRLGNAHRVDNVRLCSWRLL